MATVQCSVRKKLIHIILYIEGVLLVYYDCSVFFLFTRSTDITFPTKFSFQFMHGLSL